MLYKCKELIKDGRIIPVLGRILTHSIIDCPWYSRILAHEEPELSSAVSGYTFVHAAKWSVINIFNINEIEINIGNYNQLELVKKIPYKITGHAENILLSVGRVCFSAKWNQLCLPECRNDSKCRKIIKTNLDKKWGKMKMMYEEADEEMKKYYTGIYLVGNVVYSSVPENNIEEAKNYLDILII